MFLKKLTYIIVFILFSFSGQCQDIVYSQFFNSLPYLNPSSAGLSNSLRFNLAYRNLWTGGPGYNFGSFSADMPVNAIGGGTGLLVHFQEAGPFKILNAGAIYSYQFKINMKYSISLGLNTGFIQATRKPIQFVGPDGIENIPSARHTSFDIQGGVILYSKNQYYGFSVDHLSRPFNMNSIQNKMYYKYTIHYGGQFPIHKFRMIEPDFTLSPNIILQKQGPDNIFSPGLYILINQVCFGSWVKMHYPARLSSISLYGGIYKETWRVGYSYDINFNHTYPFQMPSNEINLTFYIPVPESAKKIKCMECPSF